MGDDGRPPLPDRCTITLTEEERKILDEACGLLTLEAFIRKSALEKANRLLASTVPAQRRAAVPIFDGDEPSPVNTKSPFGV